MHISVFEFSPNHAQRTKEGCSGLITWGTIVKSGAGGCCMVKNSQIQDFLVDSVWTLCPCGTISRDNPIFYAPNWSPLHKESVHRSSGVHASDSQVWFCEFHHFLMAMPMEYYCAVRPLGPLGCIYLWLNGTKSCPRNKGRVQWHNYMGYHCETWCWVLLYGRKTAFLGCFGPVFGLLRYHFQG